MALAAPSTEKPETILLGLSGPSCSGKTTLARLLKEIFNLTLSSEDGWKISLFILHQDDFYKTDKEYVRSLSLNSLSLSLPNDSWWFEKLEPSLLNKSLANIIMNIIMNTLVSRPLTLPG